VLQQQEACDAVFTKDDGKVFTAHVEAEAVAPTHVVLKERTVFLKEPIPANIECYMEKAMLKLGDKAPDVELKDQNSQKIRLFDIKGDSYLILYFYPKDDTPGCTAQSCSFRDHYMGLKNLGAKVVVSVPTPPTPTGNLQKNMSYPSSSQ